ncbi:zinc finger protein with KRAB and SCAN domains 1-like [Sabethes cyaneus]|uniref:zinc finger protein with KRAB and SCAN domains 1-like n=1 Tax=Sabethes cyaneus TaxID=53552 RepID=UPI00237D63A9|nr:zinc finger protein with KRAB and SCAN domains 1-like [Sabethes cyaneus]XP_053694649.1 zinc finger protein with KRAB and SCAN domains 1-like [Sabethes cyaneus]XP_053694657.1 zinc finger protein with KRAB and SCAN domains 1-like [Sabethes cyaneus]
MNAHQRFVKVKREVAMNSTKMHCCRLCLRLQPQMQFREIQVEVELHLKILEATDVDIQAQDETTVVCTNCLQLVDIVYRFRTACQRANTILANCALQVLPAGSWDDEETRQALVDCHDVVKRHYSDIEDLYNRSGPVKSEHFEMEYVVTSDDEDEGENEDDGEETIDYDEDVIQYEEETGEYEGYTEVYEEGTREYNGKTSDYVEEIVHEELIIKDESLVLFDNKSHSDQDSDRDEDDYFDRPHEFPEPSKTDRIPINTKYYCCDKCGKLVLKTSSEYHENKHQGIKPYSCPRAECGMTFYSQRTCKVHEKQVHETAQLECEVCNILVKGIHAYRRHMDNHSTENPRKTECTICGKLFFKSYMKDHMSVHSGQMHFECTDCGQRFGANAYLLKHRRRYHRS